MTVDTAYSGKQVRILKAAERLFAARGFDGASVRDITTAAGVNLATITYYFGSKEGFLAALFIHHISVMGMHNRVCAGRRHSHATRKNGTPFRSPCGPHY